MLKSKFDVSKLETFKNKSIKKFITVFGYRFSSILVDRGKGKKSIQVPIEFANKEKFIRAIDSSNQLDSTFPRIVFEITGFSPNTDKNDNQNNIIKCINSDGSVSFVNSPSWFDLDITMSVVTLNIDDGLQIVENIVSDFRPSESWQILILPEINRIESVVVTLQSASLTDNWSGSLEERRYIEWQINFKGSIPIYGNVYNKGDQKIILNSQGSSGDSQTNIVYDKKTGSIIEEVVNINPKFL